VNVADWVVLLGTIVGIAAGDGLNWT